MVANLEKYLLGSIFLVVEVLEGELNQVMETGLLGVLIFLAKVFSSRFLLILSIHILLNIIHLFFIFIV